MKIDLSPLSAANRILFSIELVPLQGDRFQPTGFPSLGAATYQTKNGLSLLVESAQSMANRMEAACWDPVANAPIATLNGLSHVTVNRKGAFLTDTMLEAHRVNSPYLLESGDKTFFNALKADLGGLEEGPVDRGLLAKTLLRFDVGSLLHGVFLAKKELAGGRLRLARAVSAFVEARGVRMAASGGVKNDHVNPSGETKSGFGNVPFARDEYTADTITLHVNIDLSQIRGYGLGDGAESMLICLSLHRVRRLIDADMRFRTACDLRVKDEGSITATRPGGFVLPELSDLEEALKVAIANCKDKMQHTTVSFDGPLKKAKDKKDAGGDADESDDDAADDGN